MTKQQRKILIKIIIGAVLFAVAMAVTHLLTLPWWAELLIFLAVYLVPGFSVLEKAVRNIAHGQVFDENFLMTIASIAAFAIGQYPEAVEVILFYQVGELFEKIAVGRSRQAVSDLLDLCPDEATVLRDGKPETVLVDEVEVGEHILVRPGEKIPLDAEVHAGDSRCGRCGLQRLCESVRCGGTGRYQAGVGIHCLQNHGAGGRIRLQQGKDGAVYH